VGRPLARGGVTALRSSLMTTMDAADGTEGDFRRARREGEKRLGLARVLDVTKVMSARLRVG